MNASNFDTDDEFYGSLMADTSLVGIFNEMSLADYNQRKKVLCQQGYRDGKQQSDELATQIQFDEGFTAGKSLGKLAGSLYATIKIFLRDNNERRDDIINDLYQIFFNELPELNSDINEKLHKIITSIKVSENQSFELNSLALEFMNCYDLVLQSIK